MNTKYSGVWTALATPFDAQGSIDWSAFDRLLEFQHRAGITGLVPCGTTGESPTLSAEERIKLIERTLRFGREKKLRVMPGTGTNNTAETIKNTGTAVELGATCALVVTPYYNKPQQRGLIEHFRAVADNVPCDIILYNVPGRTIVSVQPETVAELAKHPRIVGIKDATGDLNYATEVRNRVQSVRKDFVYLSGDDLTWCAYQMQGGSGTISVASNATPQALLAMEKLVATGNMEKATQLHDKVFPLWNAMFCEPNPVPIKYMLSLGMDFPARLRRPLVELSAENRQKIDRIAAEVKLLEYFKSDSKLTEALC